MKREGWFEAWWDYSSRPPEILLLMWSEADQLFRVREPGARGKVLHEAASYDEAKLWLTEDEYTRVEGRVSLDD